MRDNIYSLNQYGGSRSIVLNSTDGAPTCKNMIIEGEIDGQQSGNEHIIYQTTATLELYQKNATTWTFDFSEKFLLPQIDHVSYTVVLDEGKILFQLSPSRTRNLFDCTYLRRITFQFLFFSCL